MRRTLCTFLLVLGASSSGLLGQTPVKSRPVRKDIPAVMTDQEKNIRAYIELLRSSARKERAQLVGAVMQLDADDSATFWPIFKDFETEYAQFGDGVVALIKNYTENYATMTNEVADQLATKLLDLEQTRNNLKRKYYLKLRDALDAITAARFLQVENQLERIADLQISSELPVMEAPNGGQP
jgi:hypothetical protein